MNFDKEYFLPNNYKNEPQESNKEMCFGFDKQYKVYIEVFGTRFPFFQKFTDKLGSNICQPTKNIFSLGYRILQFFETP